MNPVNVKDYTYELPAEKIAHYPLEQRDQSKLLVYQAGTVSHHQFTEITALLPANSQLFFNDTKVIPARIHFRKDTGATIEIFLLTPVHPSTVMATVMEARGACAWQCAIGNQKRWKQGASLTRALGDITLTATLMDEVNSTVNLQWSGNIAFAELIALAGATPLPPYIKREAQPADSVRYQTVYSKFEGAVAAPTAGLHFTDTVLRAATDRGMELDFLTLHVSAGTFLPVKTEDAGDHIMHEEQLVVSKHTIRKLLLDGRYRVAVGTTSVRTLESLYWFGVKLLEDPDATFHVSQNDPYKPRTTQPTLPASLGAVLAHMESRKVDSLVGTTAIYIVPGYAFRVMQGLITNFHQPGSTLILLVAAFIGERWKQVYHEALTNNYRFLSYGDSSLLMP